MNCSEILRNFSSWKGSTSSAISAYQAKGSTTQADDDAIILKEKEMLDASLCISEAINNLGSTSSDIAALHEKILAKTAELHKGEADISIAKDRVTYIRNPERNTSNYESWFPIDRPLHPASIVILIALSIFMGVFFLLSLMSAFDVTVMLYMDPAYSNRSNFILWLREQFTTSFWVVLVVLISVVIYFVKRN